MESLLKDIRYGLRGLLKRPGFTLVALITLALGIGANTAIFSVVNAVVLRPLPYAEPEQLLTLWETLPGSDRRAVAPGNFLDWRTQNKTFEELAATFYANFNLTSDGEPDRIDGATITSNLMTMLGALWGRELAPLRGNERTQAFKEQWQGELAPNVLTPIVP